MPASQSNLEIDLAVARGDTYLHRARFRPSTILTVGSNPMTTITLSGDDLPEFHELIRLTEDGVILRFTADLKVEVLSGPGQVLTSEVLIQRGLARPSGEGYALPLEMGGKAVVRLGVHKLMFRVEPATTAPVRTVRVKTGEAPRCPSCNRDQPLALTAGAAITVCEGCGTWTVFTRPGGTQGALEDTSTQIGVSPNLRISPDKGVGAAAEDILGADLPTFDAIQAFKDDEGLRTMDAVQALRGDAPEPPPKGRRRAEIGPASGAAKGPTSSGAAKGPTSSGASGTRPSASQPPVADRSADLPTFDAISAIREDGMSTMDAVQALKGGPGEVPPAAKGPGEHPSGRPARPVNLADMVRQPEPQAGPSPAPAPGRSSVSTPPVAEPRATPPTPPAKALESGHWEETLTIQAIKPKKSHTVMYIAIGAVAFGMAFAFMIVLVLRHFGLLSF